MPNQLNINAPPSTGAFDFNPSINTGGSPYFYAPYQGFGAINQATAVLTANYSALMLNLRHPIGHGLFFTAAYTWSHSISAFRQPYMFGGGVTGQNPYNWRGDVGNSLTNVPQVFNSTIVYDLPFFKGAHGWRRALLGGWKLDEIATIQSGLSLDPALSVSNQGLATRPNVVGLLTFPKQVGQWFSTSTFAKPAAGFYGNAGTGTITGPGMIVFDTGLYKDFAITEQHVFELRGEIFNTFNHTNFATVNTTFGSSAFACAFAYATDDPYSAALFQKNCAACHQNVAAAGRIPQIEDLKNLPSRVILRTITTGAMQQQASALSANERTFLANWLGKPVATELPREQISNACPAGPAWKDTHGWAGWSPGLANTRFQSAQDAKLSAADVPRLKPKWVFAFPDATSMHSQPAVYRGRILWEARTAPSIRWMQPPAVRIGAPWLTPKCVRA